MIPPQLELRMKSFYENDMELWARYWPPESGEWALGRGAFDSSKLRTLVRSRCQAAEGYDKIYPAPTRLEFS